MNVKVTSMSSKGQVVIPSDVRKKLGIESGTNLLVLTDGSNLLLKPLNAPAIKTFDELIRASRKLVARRKIKKSDLLKIIASVRNESRS